MTPIQHIVLSCTNRKRISAVPGLRLRDFPFTDTQRRANAWIEAAAHANAPIAAGDLYLGEYWRVGTGLARSAAVRGQTSLSVLSAGVGLVHTDQPIPSYGATFAQRHPDSVCTHQAETPSAIRRQWWNALAAWPGPAAVRGARRLADLADTPGARLLVCAGPDYLDAVADDLRAAHTVLGDDRLVVFTSTEPFEGLSEVWVRCPGQLRMRLGGSMASTTVRAARAVFEALGRGDSLNADVARRRVDSLLRNADPLPHFNRVPLSDREVIEWIRADAEANPNAANKSAALRRLRTEGFACAQGRFGSLYPVATKDTP